MQKIIVGKFCMETPKNMVWSAVAKQEDFGLRHSLLCYFLWGLFIKHAKIESLAGYFHKKAKNKEQLPLLIPTKKSTFRISFASIYLPKNAFSGKKKTLFNAQIVNFWRYSLHESLTMNCFEGNILLLQTWFCTRIFM